MGRGRRWLPDGALAVASGHPLSDGEGAAATLPAVLNSAGAQGYVTGSLAGQFDFLNDVSQRLPLIIGVVMAGLPPPALRMPAPAALTV